MRFATLGAAILAIIVAAHLLQPPLLSRTANSLIRSFHAPGFAVVTIALIWLLGKTPARPARYLIAPVAALFAGIVSELAQLGTDRHADLQDLLTDVVGICAGLGVAVLSDRGIRATLGRGQVVATTVLTVIFAVMAVQKSASVAHALISRNSAVPVLLTFAKRWENLLYRVSDPRSSAIVDAPASWPVSSDGKVLRAEAAGKYNTFLLIWPYPDWGRFGSFGFVAAAADGRTHEVTVTVRDIPGPTDERRNSFHRRFEVGPEPRRYSISMAEILAKPGGREVDLGHVDEVVISVSRDGLPATLFIDDFRLYE